MALMDGLNALRQKLKWLDPFTYVDILLEKTNPFPAASLSRTAFDWTAYLFFGLLFAWIIYTALGLLLGTSSPLVIVLSPSMEPAMYRGDLIVLQGVPAEGLKAEEVALSYGSLKQKSLVSFAEINYSGAQPESISFTDADGARKEVSLSTEGDVIVYNSNVIENFPVIHRVIAKIKALDGYYFLTKGDNTKTNNVIDQDCVRARCIHTHPVNEKEIQGKVIFRLPLAGCLKLIPFEGKC
ncbi:S26 family signal peptidase [archaeon]|nr:S26 family signal peptidase [archaeon]